jgi:hypothetical protein
MLIALTILLTFAILHGTWELCWRLIALGRDLSPESESVSIASGRRKPEICGPNIAPTGACSHEWIA